MRAHTENPTVQISKFFPDSIRNPNPLTEVASSPQSDTARDQLLKLARDLPYMANAKSKPVGVVLAEAKAKLRAIEDSIGGERQPFQRITVAELAPGKFDLTYLIEGVLVKDQPAGLS